MGDVVSIVGPKGSGKTTLINDIELFADGSTPTGRRVFINGLAPKPEYRDDPAHHPIALITQHTNFLSDLPAQDFLSIHAEIRSSNSGATDEAVAGTMAFANSLTGEAILPEYRMTELSGRQARALLIADAVVIGNTPIVLLDEIENAGIHRMRALELLHEYRKIETVATLQSDAIRGASKETNESCGKHPKTVTRLSPMIFAAGPISNPDPSGWYQRKPGQSLSI